MKTFLRPLPLALCVAASILCGCQKAENPNAQLEQKIQSLQSEIGNLRHAVNNLRQNSSNSGLATTSDVNRVEQKLNGMSSRMDAQHKEVAELLKRIPVPKESPPVVARPKEKSDLKEDLPYGIPVVGKKGMVFSPYAPEKGQIDIDGLRRHTQVECPYSGKKFRVP